MAAPGFGFIAWASRLVPPARRAEWRREWEAETAYGWMVLQRNGRAGALQRLRLRARISTCLIDALWEGKERMMMTGLFNDLRFAARSLMRYPAFTAVAVLTLALGIGANTAVFTLVDGVLLRPLSFPESDRLLALRHEGRDGQDQLPMSEGFYQLYQDEASSLESVGLYVGTVVNLVANGEPERVTAQVATPSFFDALRVPAQLGRTFTPEEGLPGAEPVTILSDGLWRSNFGADPTIVGQTVDMNGVLRRVVGIMPAGFGHPDRDARLWLPMEIDPTQAFFASFGAGGVARLGPGATAQSAQTEIQGLIDRLEEFAPDEEAAFLRQVKLQPIVVPLKDDVVGDIQGTLWIILGTVGFVLLIACANVANLLLVRAEGRHREMALRVAVGAGRGGILRNFLSESVMLAALGGALGTVFAALAVRVSIGFIPTDVPRLDEIGVDGRVLAFTAAVALGCALFFGLFPMVRYGAGDLAAQLRDGGNRGSTGGRERHRLRNGLVVLQVAMALVLLVGSGLMLRSFVALRGVNPGFQTEGILTARISVPSAEIPDWQGTSDFFDQLRARVASQPGVAAAGYVSRAPLSGGGTFGTVEIEDHPTAEGDLPPFAHQGRAGEGYFDAMGIPLVAGRGIQAGDGATGTRAVVVSAAFAKHWWPDGSALGRRLRDGGPDEEWWDIVGVVGDVRQWNLVDDPREAVYFPPVIGAVEAPIASRTLDLVVKANGDPIQFVGVLRRELRDLNPRIALSNPRTMHDVFRGATARTSFTMAVLGAASGIALLLGLVGIYGVISYVVSQRTREIGVRMALGASMVSVRGMVVRQGLVLAGVGVVLGLAGAGAMSSVMQSMLFGVSATDPVTYGVVALALVSVATVASWLPAHRASRVDPSTALRSE
ncbi:MAG TPA: ABC transporter permease [Longimicrobiales bacterium]|nr:ABC transporter permease [Longimicrobiales bacterium]